MAAFKTYACRVCKAEGLARPGLEGTVDFLPRDWLVHEDRTPERTKAMANVCSEKCVRRLKELNRAANNKRTGW